jgi:hypothetical protein
MWLVVPLNDPDLFQFSFYQLRNVSFTVVHMDVEISQRRLSSASKGAGFDAFQSSVAEILRIYFVVFWQRIKQHKFLPGEMLRTRTFSNHFSNMVLLEHRLMLVRTSKIPKKINHASCVSYDDSGKLFSLLKKGLLYNSCDMATLAAF